MTKLNLAVEVLRKVKTLALGADFGTVLPTLKIVVNLVDDTLRQIEAEEPKRQEPPQAQVIDLMQALTDSLKKRGERLPLGHPFEPCPAGSDWCHHGWNADAGHAGSGCSRPASEHEKRPGSRSLDEALNSGDGTYKP
jgi:hypothetical protein